MSLVDVALAETRECPFNAFAPCKGERCMAWNWFGRPFDLAETDNLVDTEEGQRPIGVPPLPDDQGGWEADGVPFKKGYHQSSKNKLPQATAQRWRRPRKVVMGYCGRTGRHDHDDYIPF